MRRVESDVSVLKSIENTLSRPYLTSNNVIARMIISDLKNNGWHFISQPTIHEEKEHELDYQGLGKGTFNKIIIEGILDDNIIQYVQFNPPRGDDIIKKIRKRYFLNSMGLRFCKMVGEQLGIIADV